MAYLPYPQFPPKEPIRPTHRAWQYMSDSQRDRYLQDLASYLSHELHDLWPDLCAMRNTYQQFRQVGQLDPQWKL